MSGHIPTAMRQQVRRRARQRCEYCLLAEEDAWADAVAREWADELSDPRQDIYTLADGEPVR